MYYYFHSDANCAVKLNGIYYGIIGKTIKGVRVDGDFCPFVEIIPASGKKGGYSFLLGKEVLTAPFSGLTVTDLKGGYLLNFTDVETDDEFYSVKEEKIYDTDVKIFNDKGIIIAVTNRCGKTKERVCFYDKQVTVTPFSFCGSPVIAVFFENEKRLYLFDVASVPRKIFENKVSAFSVKGDFATKYVLPDMAKHTVIVYYNYDGKNLSEKNRTVSAQKDFSIISLPQNLVPYAMMEALLAGDDLTPFLTGKTAENKDRIKGFFGEFTGITPPPAFKPQELLGVVRKISDKIYSVEYFSFEFEDGKICNIKKCKD